MVVSPPSQSDRAGVAETHVSTVFFVGDRAYKLKKPVALGFLDLASVEARREACHREVELNRRFSPDVYLGVLDVVGVDGHVCDHLVAMRRMPAERRLSRLVNDGEDVRDALDDVVKTVAVFHACAPTVDGAGSLELLRSNWEQSLVQVGQFEGLLPEDDIRRVQTLVSRYLDRRASLFDERVRDGWGREGHGDLLADDIFLLDDGPRILDCLEFDDRLRCGDVLADIAFLSMDLERLGAEKLADHVMRRWAELLGETHPASLEHHYIAQRAFVRCKVACLRASQGDSGAAGDAASLLSLTLRHLEQARVRLVLVGGLPGTGKSTLAEALGRRLGFVVLRSDEVRKHVGADYTPAGIDRVYREMLVRAEQAVQMGESVILDATFSSARWRNGARAVATATATDLVELRCDAPAAAAAARLRTRTERFGSDATPAVAAAMAGATDPWPSATRIDTAGPVSAALESALATASRPR